jgi:uncharacterized paraquat-inducible protein A
LKVLFLAGLLFSAYATFWLSKVIYQDNFSHQYAEQRIECMDCTLAHPENVARCSACYLPGPNYVRPAALLATGLLLSAIFFWFDRIRFRG